MRRIVGEEGFFESGVVLHEVPADGFGKVDILLELVVKVLKYSQDTSPFFAQTRAPAFIHNLGFLSDVLT